MKKRIPTPNSIAARVLFDHDRTCCICRKRAKSVQIHHIDCDPYNHEMHKLAVLCFDCHRDTQMSGGFDRKLDKDQIILYRGDWCRIVQQQRIIDEAKWQSAAQDISERTAYITSIAENRVRELEYVLTSNRYAY